MMMIGTGVMIMLLPGRRAVIVLGIRIAVMPEIHAHAAADGRKALHLNGEDQHGERKRAEQLSEHRARLYVRCLAHRGRAPVAPSGAFLADLQEILRNIGEFHARREIDQMKGHLARLER